MKLEVPLDYNILKIAHNICFESNDVSTISRTAGTIEFKKDQGPVRRNIRVQGFKWSPDRLRELSKILWACERAHSYSIAGLRLFSRMPASDFSPDGLLGGVGYIQSIPNMRSSLSQAVETLSTFCDTLHDEINAGHWSQASDDPNVQSILDNTAEIKNDPEGFVQEEYESEVNDGSEVRNPQPEDFNPSVESENEASEEDDDDWNALYAPVASSNKHRVNKETHSELPKDETPQKSGLSSVEMVMNTLGDADTTSSYASAISRIPEQLEERYSMRSATSSLPVETMSQPRVDTIGPGEGGEFGYFNDPSDWPSDDLMGEGFTSLDPLYEGFDAHQDGNTGYSNPTDGDETYLKLSHSIAGYSWLPGSRNEKLFNYYDPSLTEDDINWLRANDEPESPIKSSKPVYVSDIDPIFERII